MKVVLAAVGRVRAPLDAAVAEYEARTRRYFTFDALEVKEEATRHARDVERVRDEESNRLLARVPARIEVVALHREGAAWSSERLAEYLSGLALQRREGVAFLIGGAFGLSEAVLSSAAHRLSLSGFTLPHELARLMLTEQLYRAGTILRGEPYHKARRG